MLQAYEKTGEEANKKIKWEAVNLDWKPLVILTPDGGVALIFYAYFNVKLNIKYI